MSIYRKYTKLVQRASIDECYLDLTILVDQIYQTVSVCKDQADDAGFCQTKKNNLNFQQKFIKKISKKIDFQNKNLWTSHFAYCQEEEKEKKKKKILNL